LKIAQRQTFKNNPNRTAAIARANQVKLADLIPETRFSQWIPGIDRISKASPASILIISRMDFKREGRGICLLMLPSSTLENCSPLSSVMACCIGNLPQFLFLSLTECCPRARLDSSVESPAPNHYWAGLWWRWQGTLNPGKYGPR